MFPADDHYSHTGIHIQGKGKNNLQSRLGVKAYVKGHSPIDDNTDRSFKLFMEVNWYHNTQRYGVQMDGDSLTQDGARNIGEIKTGVEGQINSQFNIWSSIGIQIGDKGYSDTRGVVGIKYHFS